MQVDVMRSLGRVALATSWYVRHRSPNLYFPLKWT